MTLWIYCPRCGKAVDEFEERCAHCDLGGIWEHNWRIISEELEDFMTTGTPPNMVPRADNG